MSYGVLFFWGAKYRKYNAYERNKLTIDNRYDDELLSTHDKVKIPCIKTERLSYVWSDSINIEPKIHEDERDLNSIPHVQQKIKVATSDVILINEGQFFEDLYEVVVEMLKQNILISLLS